MTPKPNWEAVKKNPSYFSGALSEAEGYKTKWHRYSYVPYSSQVVCISVFGALRHLADGDAILNEMMHAAFPEIPKSSEEWNIELEKTNGALLGETGLGESTNVDALCTSKKAAICVEAKFLRDAQEGFGWCHQWELYLQEGTTQWKRDCAGFYGRGSDLKKNTEALCRLSVKDGKREARRYWELAPAYFREEVFQSQVFGQQCPFAKSNFQLMRNFLFAAETARNQKHDYFGVIAVVPDSISEMVRGQVADFKDQILQDGFKRRINIVTYEFICDLLSHYNDEPTNRLRNHLTKCLEMVTPKTL